MGGSFKITIQGSVFCEANQNETILTALVRAGAALAAPCGGRGVCGKCRVKLIEGTVRLAEFALAAPFAGHDCSLPEMLVKAGDSFSACKGIALSDITLSLSSPNAGMSAMLHSRSPSETRIKRAGVGLDIGTTTVHAELVDLDSGESIETVSALNDQRSYGADVMSRINAVRHGKLGELIAATNRQTEKILRYFIDKWNLSGIEKCAVSGNTTMLHFFAGVDPRAMGEAPFTPQFLEEQYFEGKKLSLSAEQIILLPGISAFVGSDITAGLAFIDILNKQENSLFIDIGTNGEMAVWKKNEKKLLCCSTAAGPCFEGSEISCGMSALPGAIDRIGLKSENIGADFFSFGSLAYSTIGNIKPCGICGAGLIDAIAAMKRLTAIDETGTLADEYAQSGFPVAPGIVITQKDVRQFQLAKSAIFSGIKILCKSMGIIPAADIGTVYIAGGFGLFLNIKNACAVGLLPPEFADKPEGKVKTVVCGNTSLKGAVKCLNDNVFMQRCREIVSRSSTADLAHNNNFSEAFASNMWFGLPFPQQRF